MLSLLIDNRTGKNIELIIPVYNEEYRLLRIIKAYGNILDIVIIDDTSTDNTIELAIKNNCTIFSRNRSLEPVSFAPTEHPIVYYIHHNLYLWFHKNILKLLSLFVYILFYNFK